MVRARKRKRAAKPPGDPVYIDGYTWFYPSRRGFEFTAYSPSQSAGPPVTFKVPAAMIVEALEGLGLVRRVR